MIVPSIDIMDGRAVQLVGGKEKVLDAGDPVPLAEHFRLAGEIAVIDLDAALGRGENRDVIDSLLRIAPCRVGGGIRDFDTALQWLDAGARKVIIGTAAVPELLERLPRERVIAALDAEHGEVVVEGWQKGTGRGVVERMLELNELVSGYLVTFVEREGRLGGTALDKVMEVVENAGGARVTIAGGITTAEEIARLDELGADAQVGMAIYTKKLHLADAFAAPLKSDRPDGLWPTVVADEHGSALGLVYSSAESLRDAFDRHRGVYYSRSREELWAKGETSGAVQELLSVDADCDRDALLFKVLQHEPGFCHNRSWTCWGEDTGLGRLERRLAHRLANAPEGSYTARLYGDEALLAEKLREEAEELAEAAEREEVVWEAADLLYFMLVRMRQKGVALSCVEEELERRSLRITRRGGDGKSGKGE